MSLCLSSSCALCDNSVGFLWDVRLVCFGCGQASAVATLG